MVWTVLNSMSLLAVRTIYVSVCITLCPKTTVFAHDHSMRRSGGMEQFIGSTIVASNYSKLFVTCDLPTHSLCRFLGIPTPSYKITHWVSDCDFLYYSTTSTLRLKALHTPGPAPDSLAFWDDDDKTLFVGDTLYEWA